MSWSSRSFLIVAAASVAGYCAAIASIGAAHSASHVEGLRPTLWLIGLGIVVSFPFWLPAIIPRRFPLLSRIIRWLCALMMAIPIWLSMSVVIHNLSRWRKGWEWWPSLVSEQLVATACFIATMVVLVWPEIRLWLRGSVAVMKPNEGIREKPTWEKALIAVGALFFCIFLVMFIQSGYFIYDMNVSSELSIRNWSGSDVRFEKVTVEDQPVWEKPHIIIKTIKNFEKPWLDKQGDSISAKFRAPKKEVELKVTTVNEMQESETVSCILDNRRRPSSFEVFYYKAGLVAHDRRNGDYTPKRGPYGEGEIQPNWPNPQWPAGPHKQPIR